MELGEARAAGGSEVRVCPATASPLPCVPPAVPAPPGAPRELCRALRAAARAPSALLGARGALRSWTPGARQGAALRARGRETLPVKVMCAEEAQKHSRRLAEDRARLPGEDPRGHREGGQLLQEPGGTGGQADSRGHHALRVLPVAGGLREVQDQRPQGGQSGAACQHRALLAVNGHRDVFPAGGHRLRREEAAPTVPLWSARRHPVSAPSALAPSPLSCLPPGAVSPGLPQQRCPFRGAGASGACQSGGVDEGFGGAKKRFPGPPGLRLAHIRASPARPPSPPPAAGLPFRMLFDDLFLTRQPLILQLLELDNQERKPEGQFSRGRSPAPTHFLCGIVSSPHTQTTPAQDLPNPSGSLHSFTPRPLPVNAAAFLRPWTGHPGASRVLQPLCIGAPRSFAAFIISASSAPLSPRQVPASPGL